MERKALNYLRWGFVFILIDINVGRFDLLPDFLGMLFLFASIQCDVWQTEAQERVKVLFLVLAADYFLHWILPFQNGLENLMITIIFVYAVYVFLGEVMNLIREDQPDRAKRLGRIRICLVLLQAAFFLLSAYEEEFINFLLIIASLTVTILLLVTVCGIKPRERQ